LLSLGSAACGSDTNVSVHFTSGTVSETAQCRGSRGEFPLRQTDGLEVIVVVTDETTIVRANFTPGTCDDIVAGTQASVRGSNQSGRIQATEIEIGP
jgi:hypothetical protein